MKASVSKLAREGALAQIKTAMIEKKLTQAEIADAADCHEKTIQNLLGGRSVREQTLFDVCMVLGLDYDKLKEAWDGKTPRGPEELQGEGGLVAPVYMGAYTRAAVDHYIGSYLTVRPSFAQPGVIVAFRTDVSWEPDWPSLLFQERDRPDAPYSHRGRLYIPASSMFIHLVSLTKGAMRRSTALVRCGVSSPPCTSTAQCYCRWQHQLFTKNVRSSEVASVKLQRTTHATPTTKRRWKRR